MNRKTFTSLNYLLWAASLVILSGCYTVLLHQPTRVADNESGPVDADSTYEEISFQDRCMTCHGNDFHAYEYADFVQSYGLMNSPWRSFEGAEPWWRNMPGYDSSEDQSMSNTADAMRRHYGRRREALHTDNNDATLTVGYVSTGSSIPSSVLPLNGTSVTADSSKSQSTNTAGSNTQTTKSKSQNTQREYGARESAKKR